MNMTAAEPAAYAGEAVPPVLETRQLEVVYNRVQLAVQGVSIRVPQGGIVALLGTNGAGKSTTLRAISGFLPVDNAAITDGQVLLDGHDIKGKLPHECARRGVALVPERDKIFATLTVEENFRAIGAKDPPDDRKEELQWLYDLFPILAERRHQVAGYLSGGERQMLAIATTLLLRPRVMLVDELSFGLAPALVGKLMDSLKQINQVRKTAILLVEQNAPAALEIADHAYIMETGRVVFDGTPDVLRQHKEVREFYLGLHESTGVRSYADVKQYRRKRQWWG